MLASNLKLSGLHVTTENGTFFTEDNKKVWEISFKQKQDFIKKYHNFIFKDYIDGFYALEFNSDEIPTLEKLNSCLKVTGWQVAYVDGYLHQNYYAELLLQKIAPISRHMRSLAHLNYAPGPDMLHDIFGHLPMLFSPGYSDYLIALAKVMAQASANTCENQLYHLYIKLAHSHEELGSNHPQTKECEKKIQQFEHDLNKSPPTYTLLGRFFMWTIEFGILLNPENKPQMYGAGLLSSENESMRFCKGQTKVAPFTHASIKIGYDFSSFQKQLFFSNSFKSLSNKLKKFEKDLFN